MTGTGTGTGRKSSDRTEPAGLPVPSLLNTTRDSIRREESRKQNIESNSNSSTYTQDLDKANQALQGLYQTQADCVALLRELSYQLGMIKN